MKFLLRTLILLSFMGACSGDRDITEHMDSTGENIHKFGENLRQDACEMIDGKLECAIEKAQRDVDDAVN